MTKLSVRKLRVRGYARPWIVRYESLVLGSFSTGSEALEFVLANQRSLVEPVPFTGSLGLRRLDDATITRVLGAIA
jgi:hypothetical protein